LVESAGSGSGSAGMAIPPRAASPIADDDNLSLKRKDLIAKLLQEAE
jgi:hypothetical protein